MPELHSEGFRFKSEKVHHRWFDLDLNTNMKPSELTRDMIENAMKDAHSITSLCDILKLKRQNRTYKILRNLISIYAITYPSGFRDEVSSSVLDSLSNRELEELVNTSSSYAEIISKLKLRHAGANYRTLQHRLENTGIDLSGMKNRRTENIRKNLLARHTYDSYDDVKKCNFTTIRKYIIKNSLLEYKCQIPECGNLGWHCGKPLTLELDHIDGDRGNNELNNLRFLCPSCHSQTETYAGKARILKIDKFCLCGNKLGRDNLSGTCSPCTSKARDVPKKFEITKYELESLVVEHSLLKIGEMFGVSDNAIRKRCMKLGIDVKSLSRFSHQRICSYAKRPV